MNRNFQYACTNENSDKTNNSVHEGDQQTAGTCKNYTKKGNSSILPQNGAAIKTPQGSVATTVPQASHICKDGIIEVLHVSEMESKDTREGDEATLAHSHTCEQPITEARSKSQMQTETVVEEISDCITTRPTCIPNPATILQTHENTEKAQVKFDSDLLGSAVIKKTKYTHKLDPKRMHDTFVRSLA